ncbi:transcriptional regulator [Lachnospiraceae bacterium]|nr:transcriptional regulator [Lachnospiraceae bacterium]GKH41242.1 transcriptional regulator [Lachnospiraceae bacterium]
MNLQEMKSEILENAEVQAEYEKLKPEYDVVRAVLEARKKNHLTQQQLADRTGINRADISKLENGSTNPSIALLQRIAEGMDMQLKLEFVPKHKMISK